MTQSEYLEAYDAVIATMREITRRKNSDYAIDNDAFQNFRLAEHLKITDTARGILVRMTDKFQRICNLIGGEQAAVLDEKIDDTLMDLANYAIILRIYLGQRAECMLPKLTSPVLSKGLLFNPAQFLKDLQPGETFTIDPSALLQHSENEDDAPK